MKSKNIINSLLSLAVAATFCLCASCAQTEKEKQDPALLAKAKISKADAEKTALKKAPDGTIKESELEEEKGKLIWSFDIARPKTADTTEVNVNAITGKVVNVEIEKPKKEKDKDKEEKEDEKAKH